MSAKLLVPEGSPDHRKAGETPLPSQVNSTGISDPVAKPSISSWNGISKKMHVRDQAPPQLVRGMQGDSQAGR